MKVDKGKVEGVRARVVVMSFVKVIVLVQKRCVKKDERNMKVRGCKQM